MCAHNMKFSVVIPLYNKEQSISSSIESVLNQVHKDFELIIVNDGSTDKSLQVVQGYDDKRINIVTQRNQGVSVARNLGAELAQYDYLVFIDADDMWDPNFLETVSNMRKQRPHYECYATAWASWSRGVKISSSEYRFDTEKVRLVDFLSESINDVVVHIGSLVISHRAFLDVGGFPVGVKVFEDQDLNCRLALRAPFVFYTEPMMYYVRDAENRACSNRSIQDMPPFFTKCEDMMIKNHGAGSKEWHLKEFMISRYLNEVSLACQTPGERWRAIAWLWLCRKTKISKFRFWKATAYLFLPARVLSYLISFARKSK